jgi:hypothetical protein
MISRGLKLARWVPVTAVLAETAVGAYWDLARISYVRDSFDHLGYPLYFATILGVAKTAALAAILTPGHPQTKEWAYAGLAAATFAARAWLPQGESTAATLRAIGGSRHRPQHA